MGVLKSTEVIGRAIENFNNVKNALDYVGVDTSKITSDEYGNSIRQFKSSLDKVGELEEQVDNLELSNSELSSEIENYNSDFDDIYDAIVTKGQNPDKDDKSTYAGAILAIETSSGGGDEYEITNAMHLFGYDMNVNARTDLIDILLPHCKNVINWKEAFLGCLIPNGKTVEIDMSKVTDVNLMAPFKYTSPENTNAEITLKANTNGILRNIFYLYNDGKKYGLTNIEIHDKSNGGANNLSDLFHSCQNVKSLVLDFDASNIQYMNKTFEYFNYYNKTGQLTVIDLSNTSLDGDKLVQMNYCFKNSKYPEEIRFPQGFTISNCSMSEFAYNATYLKKINLDIVDDPNGSGGNFYWRLFEGCNNLEEIVTTKPRWIIYNNFDACFANCNKLANFPVIEFHIMGYNRCGFGYCFYQCYELEELEIYIHNDVVTNAVNGEYTFYKDSKLKHIRGNLDLSLIGNTNNMFNSCTALETIETTGSFGGLNTGTASLTLDLSASAVFNASDYINSLASNNSGKTRIIKLNATVYNGLTQETKNLAISKNYTLASA